MAAEKQDDGFRLSFDEDSVEEDHHQIQSEIEDLKVEKLSQRVTIITILIPILIVVILGVTYLDIKRRVISTETSGSKGFQNLSRDIESRFSSLSLRQAKLEEAFSKENARLNEASAAMGVRIKETDTALKALSEAATTQKALKQALAQTLSGLDEKLAPLTQQLARTNAQMTSQGQDTVARLSELEGLITTMDPVIADLRSNLQTVTDGIETLTQEKISKEQMDLALKLDRFRIISDLQAEDKRLDEQLGALSRQLTLVRGEIATLQERLGKPRATAPSPSPAPKPAVNQPTQPAARPKPTTGENASRGGITEQDLN